MGPSRTDSGPRPKLGFAVQPRSPEIIEGGFERSPQFLHTHAFNPLSASSSFVTYTLVQAPVLSFQYLSPWFEGPFLISAVKILLGANLRLPWVSGSVVTL